MDRLISEQAVIDTLSHWYSDMLETGKEQEDLIEVIKAIPSAEPSGDLISREAVIDELNKWDWQELYLPIHFKENIIDVVPSVKPQEPYDFAKWVATEIFDDMWEYNKDSFAEIACRKLEKLGIVGAKGDEWELIEEQESEVQDADSN